MVNIFKGTSWWIIVPAIIILIAIPFLSMPGLLGSDSSKKRTDDVMKNITQKICDQLDEYYSENGAFPTSLSMLETEFPESYGYHSYAYYPAENPTSYHIGVTLRLKDNVILNDDADFNSKAAGYINGFDGGGQVFDIHVSK